MTTILKKVAGLVLGVALFASSVHAQEAATILSTNTDLKNRRVFVELAFNGQGCATYNLKFKLQAKNHDYGYQKIAAVLGGPVLHVQNSSNYLGATVSNCVMKADTTYECPTGTAYTAGDENRVICKLKNGDTTMYDMKMAGYSLVFNIPAAVNLSPNDSVTICMEAIVFATQCNRCGVANTDMVFVPAVDIKPGCPEASKVKGLVACYQRDSKVANWEGWVFDPRDCQSYRIVRMPDNRWWFAQNLSYTAGLTPANSASGTAPGNQNGNYNLFNTTWYAAGRTTPGNTQLVESTGNVAVEATSQKTYGMLYPWGTVMSLDGVVTNPASGENDAALQNGMAQGATSLRRAICPVGWVVPSRYDWGKMINLVEKECASPCAPDGSNPISGDNKTSPCFHNYSTATNQWAASRCAFKDLLSTDVAPYRTEAGLGGSEFNYNGDTSALPRQKLLMPDYIQTYASDANPSWNYFKPETAGTDKWGFSIKPTGLRNGVDVGAPGEGFYYRGEFAGFWTSTQEVQTNSSKPDYATSAKAYMVGFRYNYRMNADFNSAVQNWAVGKKFGLAVRCVAKTTN